jgi:hypothetical protein
MLSCAAYVKHAWIDVAFAPLALSIVTGILLPLHVLSPRPSRNEAISENVGDILDAGVLEFAAGK